VTVRRSYKRADALPGRVVGLPLVVQTIEDVPQLILAVAEAVLRAAGSDKPKVVLNKSVAALRQHHRNLFSELQRLALAAERAYPFSSARAFSDPRAHGSPAPR
jgi:hypothetical protein